MISSPLDSTHGHMKSGVTCHHCLWTTHTVGLGRQRRAWHDITALGQHTRSDYIGRGMTSPPLDSTHRQTTSGHTRSDYVGRGMTSPPLDSTHSRTTSGVAFHHRLWAAHTIERCWVGHDITAFGQHTRSNDVGCDMSSPPVDSTLGRTTSAHTVERHRAWHDITSLGLHTRSDEVGCGMLSPPLHCTHGRQYTLSDDVRSGMTSPPLAAQTVKLHRAWHNISALRQHTQSNDIERGMTSSPLSSTHSRTTSGVAFHHSPWMANNDDVWRGITSPPLDNTHGRQRRAWHDIAALGLHIRSNDVGRGMTTRPLDSTHGRTMLGHKRSNDVRRGMTSLPLDSTHGRTTWGMAGHHRPWTVHTVGNVGRDMPSLPLDTRSNDVGLYMSSPPLESTHGRTTTAHTVERRLAWHDITALGLHARLDDVGHITSLVQHTRSNDVEQGMTSPPMDCTHGRTTTHGRHHRAWHDITALGHHTRSETSGMACHHHPWTAHIHTRSNDIGRGMTLPPLYNTHSQTTSSDSTHGRQHRAWHDITALGHRTRSETSGVACHHRPGTAHIVG
uniref:Uncharacterized protein n=1 Tax=Solanum lycopersicum TaxID=4081 RepID=A0A494G913_SOLLC